KEPARKLTFGIVRVEPLIDAEKPLLREVLRERAVADEAEDEVDRRARVPRDQRAVRVLGAGKCVARQFGVAWSHGHTLYAAVRIRVSGFRWLEALRESRRCRSLRRE